jgi:hypothetical protein
MFVDMRRALEEKKGGRREGISFQDQLDQTTSVQKKFINATNLHNIPTYLVQFYYQNTSSSVPPSPRLNSCLVIMLKINKRVGEQG